MNQNTIYPDLEQLCSDRDKEGIIGLILKHGFFEDGIFLKRKEQTKVRYFFLETPMGVYYADIPQAKASEFESLYERTKSDIEEYAIVTSIASGLVGFVASSFLDGSSLIPFLAFVSGAYIGFRVKNHFNLKRFNDAIKQLNETYLEYFRNSKNSFDYQFILNAILSED